MVVVVVVVEVVVVVVVVEVVFFVEFFMCMIGVRFSLSSFGRGLIGRPTPVKIINIANALLLILRN